MNAPILSDTPFRDRLGHLVFRGDRVLHLRTNLEFVVNNISSGDLLDGVRFDHGARRMCSMQSAETELVH